MIEETESPADPRALAPDHRHGEALLYDLAKFVTTIALLAIGGMLSLTQTAPIETYPRQYLLPALGAVALAGVFAFGVAFALAAARAAGREPSRHLTLLLQAAISFVGLGTGGFVLMWWSALA